MRVNGVDGTASSEWTQIPVEWESLRMVLPPNTRVHFHTSEAEEDRGCSQELVEAIPTVTWDVDQADDNKTELCPVCYEDFCHGQEVALLPCSHRYHTACVAPWLLKNNSCPACRFKITTESLQTPEEGVGVGMSEGARAVAASAPAASAASATVLSPRRAQTLVRSGTADEGVAVAGNGPAAQAWEQVDIDAGLPPGSRVKVAGREGLYQGFHKRLLGANEHHIVFDDTPGGKVERLRLKSQQLFIARPSSPSSSQYLDRWSTGLVT